MTAESPRRPHHLVEVDADRCSLCEYCAKHCPTDALRIERTATELRLFFAPASCSGCPEAQSCETVCPEEALRLRTVEGEAAPDGERLLASGEYVICANCREAFAPLNKLETLAQRNPTKHAIERELCPVCRRKMLVVRFIEEKRAPGAKAEYRSTTEILRKAGYHDLAKVTEDADR